MSAAASIPRFPVIVGPTAGGKSSLAVEVALAFASRGTPAPIAAEILTADAFQLYRGMDIGTAKPTLADRKNIPHHLIDVRDPRDPTPFTVHDWLHAAGAAIADCRARNTIPILVGGTHLYIQNFLTGMFQGPGADEALRAELRARGLANLREELERVDPDAARRIHPNDERRTIRALEVFRLTGTPISEHQKQWGAEARTDCVLIILDWPTELINRRINARVKQMMADGFLEEVQRLKAEGAFAASANPQAREALGYKQLLAHLNGNCSLEDAVEQIKIDTRHFAKAQRTWLRRLRMTPGSVVIDAATTPVEEWASIVLKACSEQGPTPPRAQGLPDATDEPHDQRMLPDMPPPSYHTLPAATSSSTVVLSWLVAVGLLGILGVALTVFGGLAGRQSIAITGGIVTFISVIVLFLGGGIAAFLDRHNTSHTRKRNYFVCPHCTYQLRGLPSPGACPECGRVYTADSLKQDWENIIAMEKSGP